MALPKLPKNYITEEKETVDSIAYSYYGFTKGATEAILERNPFLVDYGPILPSGILLVLPVLNVEAPNRKLWEYSSVTYPTLPKFNQVAVETPEDILERYRSQDAASGLGYSGIPAVIPVGDLLPIGSVGGTPVSQPVPIATPITTTSTTTTSPPTTTTTSVPSGGSTTTSTTVAPTSTTTSTTPEVTTTSSTEPPTTTTTTTLDVTTSSTTTSTTSTTTSTTTTEPPTTSTTTTEHWTTTTTTEYPTTTTSTTTTTTEPPTTSSTTSTTTTEATTTTLPP